MSLDVYLYGPAEDKACSECGHVRPVQEYVFSSNITHNLNKMADAAGIYEHLWRPDEIWVTKASQLIEPLDIGLTLLKSQPERFKKFDAPNGWGLYEHFVPWVEEYLKACKENPEAEVKVSR